MISGNPTQIRRSHLLPNFDAKRPSLDLAVDAGVLNA